MTDLDSLRTFVAVARLGSLVRAAGELHRTQPSLSARLAALERGWGTKLFRRQARGMALTPEGARLLPLAESALGAVRALETAAGLPVVPSRELRVGAGDALGRHLLPATLSRLLEREPDLAVRLVEGPAPRLLESLRVGEIDLALVAGRAAEGSTGIAIRPLLESPVIVLAPRPARRDTRSVTVAALRDRRLVTLQQGSAFRRHLEEAFEAAGVPFRPAVEVGNLSLVHRFVSAGLGWGLAPAVAFAGAAAPPGIARWRLRGVAPLFYVAASRSGVPLPAAAEQLLAAVAPQIRGRGLSKSLRER